MHDAAYQAVEKMLDDIPLGKKTRVLEIGSMTVNGSIRPLFSKAGHYHGIDRRPGPDVDEVANGAFYEVEEPFDIVVCCETLEHDAHPHLIIENAKTLLKPGGWLILTCADEGRAPHGVDGGAVGGETYSAISLSALRKMFKGWDHVSLTHNKTDHDLYARAQKPADTKAAKDTENDAHDDA